MLIDVTKETMKITIFLGLIGLFIAWAFNLNGSFVQTQEINGVIIRTFDWYKYTTSISDAWSTTALQFEDILPTREWKDIGFFDWEGLFNNLALVFDWLYFPINFLLWILRWFAWILKLALALIGWDFSQTLINGTNEYNSILVKILSWVTQNLMIPYI